MRLQATMHCLLHTCIYIYRYVYIREFTIKSLGYFNHILVISVACLLCTRHVNLQTSRDASNLIESLNVVETLLLIVKLTSSCRKPSYLAILLP